MRSTFTRWLCLGSSLLTFQTALAGPPSAAPIPADPHPLRFVPNQNQWEKPVLFAAEIPAGRLFLERNRLLVARYDARAVDELHHHAGAGKARIPAHAYAVSFVGANAQPQVEGEQPTGERSNYFLGNDEHRWATNVPAYTDVRYRQLYPGTDLRFYSRGKVMEYDFELAAGADARRIRLRYEGQQGLSVVEGALRIETSVGRVTEQQPFAYQVVDGKRVAVPCHYVLGPNHTVSFGLPQGYNHALPLVIDPVLVYSTYSGATATFNWGYSACPDTLGNLYVGSQNFQPGYPTTTGAYDASFNGVRDVVISKYNPSATTGAASLLYATYLGGSDMETPHSLVVNRANELVIMGSTESPNFPTTAGAFDRTLGGSTDLFLTKLGPNGNQLLASTYIGGTGIDGQLKADPNDPNNPITNSVLYRNFGDNFRGDVITDRQNNVYFTSVTRSATYPTTGGAVFRGGEHEAVVTKLNANLSALGWSTFLGGSGDDAGYSIQLDSLNNVYVCGGTTSNNLPSTAGGANPTYQGGTVDGFVAYLTQSLITPGISLRQVTYLGTSSYDQAYFVQLDRKGAVYVMGQTSGTYTITPGIFTFGTAKRQFIHKLNAGLTSTVFSTAFGGAGSSTVPNISPTAFLVDNCGQIMLSGWGGANIAGLFTTADALQRTVSNTTPANGTNDNLNNTFGYLYVLQLSANARRAVYGTYFGTGTVHVDGGTSRFDKKGVIYQAICVRSLPGGGMPANILTTPNAFARSKVGGNQTSSAGLKLDIVRLDAAFTPAVNGQPNVTTGCAPLTVNFTRANPSNNGTTWDFGNGQTSTQPNNVSSTYSQPGTYTVRLTAYDSLSCQPSVSTTQTVTVYGLPRASAGPDRSICPGGSVTISLTGASPVQGAVYTWSPATGLNTTAGPIVVASPTTTTQYIVTSTLIGCTSYDTVVVNVGQPSVRVSTPPSTICPGGSTLLTASAGTGATYQWSPAAGLSGTTGASVTASPTATTRYRVVATLPGGCAARDSVLVTVLTAPTLTVSSLSNVALNEPVTFVASSSATLTNYRWDYGDGTAGNSGVHTYAVPGTYTVRVTAEYGAACPLSATSTVTVADPRPFLSPNIITPNNDGMNDSFQPYLTTEVTELQVFNRWGREVFRQANYSGGWGSDANVAPGLYYYRLSTASGQSWTGWLEVVR